MMTNKKYLRIILISTASVLLTFFLVLNPIASVIVYESIFSDRYETPQWTEFFLSDFPGLLRSECKIETDYGIILAGYHYEKGERDCSPEGVVVIAHGLGGGGHNSYMPFVNYFAESGYLVFAYDATACDNSTGEDVEGLPQGIKDLDSVLNFVQDCALYQDLPVFLFGHSWGAYSSGCVLSMHPEVKAAVLISGFDQSTDMILQQGRNIIGNMVTILSPSVLLYEKCKFGVWSDYSVTEGIENSDAKVLIVHSKDDETVLPENGYDKYYEIFGDTSRVSFELYENRGHSYIFYSDMSKEYREMLNEEYLAYVEEHGGVHSAEIKTEFMREHLDKEQCFAPDPELMEKILSLYASSVMEND